MVYRVLDYGRESFHRDGDLVSRDYVLRNGQAICVRIPHPFRVVDGRLFYEEEFIADVIKIVHDLGQKFFSYIDTKGNFYIVKSPSIQVKLLSNVIDVAWRWPNIFDLAYGTHVVVFSDGKAQFGKFIDDKFQHIPCFPEDMVNSVGPLRCVRGIFQNLVPDRYQVVNEKNEMWGGRAEMHLLPDPATWLLDAFISMFPVSWSIKIHSKMSKKERDLYRSVMLVCRVKKIHFVLFLQISEFV